MGYDYKTAMEVLTESEKNRMICGFLNADQHSVDWDKATNDFESASVASFRRCIYNSLKKIEDATKNGGATASPTKATPKSSAKKRKTAVAGDGEGNGVEETPTKTKRGRKAKAANTDADDAEATPVKVEEGDELT